MTVRGTAGSLNSEASSGSAVTSPLSSHQPSPHVAKLPASSDEDPPSPPLPALETPAAPLLPAAQLQPSDGLVAGDVSLAANGSSAPAKTPGGGSDDYDLLSAVQGAGSDGSTSTSDSENSDDGSL